MEKATKPVTITPLDFAAVHVAAAEAQSVEAASLPSQAAQLEVPVVKHTKMSPRDVEQLIADDALQKRSLKTADRSHREKQHRSSSHPDIHYGKIERQFLPQKLTAATQSATAAAAPLGSGQKAHQLVIRNGRPVDVTEEAEDKLAMAALRVAEKKLQQKVAALSPRPGSGRMRSPRVDRIRLPRTASPRGQGALPRSSGSKPSTPRDSSGSVTTPRSSVQSITLSVRDIREAMLEAAKEFEVVDLQHDASVASAANTEHKAQTIRAAVWRRGDQQEDAAGDQKEAEASGAAKATATKPKVVQATASPVKVEVVQATATPVAVSVVPVNVTPVTFETVSVEATSVHEVQPMSVVEVAGPTAHEVETLDEKKQQQQEGENKDAQSGEQQQQQATDSENASPQQAKQAVAEETLDGSEHSILSLDFTDREMSDGEIIPELEELPRDKLLALLLNGNDMLTEGAEHIGKLLRDGYPIQTLQLQWNLLGSEGAAALVVGLNVTTYLRFLDLTGNELEEEGAIAIASALKENTSIQSLVIAENQIGSEGLAVLAHALKFNKALKSLDVSNNNIYSDGIEYLAEALNTNRTVAELRINGNSIQNAGAEVLAAAIKEHPTLEHLELSNCVIDDSGIVALVDAVQSNPANVMEFLDLSLNNFSISSEVHMQTLLSNKDVKCEVMWKDADQTRLFEIEEIDTIVQFYGVSNIIDKYLQEESLLPLIPFDVLLPNVSFDDRDLSDALIDSVLSKLQESRTLFIRGMDLLNILLYHLTNTEEIITEVVDNQVIESIFARLPDFLNILASDEYNNPYNTEKPRIGFVRFKVLELTVNLFKFDSHRLHQILVELRVIHHLLDLLFAWPTNNFIHHQCKDLIVIILYSQSELLLTDLLVGYRLTDRIMETYRKECELDVGFHSGFFGHLTEISNYIATSLSTFHFMPSYASHKTWQTFVENELEVVNVVLETPYEGYEQEEVLEGWE